MNVRTSNKRAAAIALALASACAATLPAQAAEKSASKQESMGVGSGLAIGALAGGPFGAIVGAAAGAWLGDRYHRKDVENHELATDLAHSNVARSKLSASLIEAQERGEQLSQMLERRSDLETQVVFRTNDASLPAGAFEQLKTIGSLVSTMPEMRVRVSGYADPRGTEDSNATLSKERADAVAAVLAGQGIDASRIVVEAHGETDASVAEGDLDGYAMERRVVIRIEQEDKDAVARN